MAKHGTAEQLARDVMVATWARVSHELCGGLRPLRGGDLHAALVSRTIMAAFDLGYSDVELYLANETTEAMRLAATIAGR